MSSPAGTAGVVLFDWNGTLVDDTTRALVATNVVLTELELAPLAGEPEFRDRFTLPLDHWMAGLGVPHQAIRHGIDRWNTEMSLRPAPARRGAAPLLERLHASGYSTGVISAASTAAVRDDARALGLIDLLDHIEGDATPKRAAISELISDTPPGRAFYVGDTEYDITEALAAGATAIGISTGYRPAAALTAAGAHHMCDELDELDELVEAAGLR